MWWERNRRVHGELSRDAKTQWAPVESLVNEFKLSMRALETPKLDRPRQICKWFPPGHGRLRMNSDAVAIEGQVFVAIGVVFRDHNGVVLSAFSRRLSGCFRLKYSRNVSNKGSLQLVANWNIHVDEVECDALQVV